MIASRQDQPGLAKAKWTLVLTGLALLSAALTALLLRPEATRSPVEAPPGAVAVSRTNLLLVAGHLCWAGQTNAFTGLMLEHSAQGSLRSRSAVSNGLLHGLSEGWHTNGQVQVTEHFKEGVSHGRRTKWYPSGRKLSEGEIVDGRFHGTFRRWSESGSLAEQVEFMDGQPHGVSLAYYPSGFLKACATLDHGRVLGQKRWPDRETKDPLSAPAGPVAALGASEQSE